MSTLSMSLASVTILIATGVYAGHIPYVPNEVTLGESWRCQKERESSAIEIRSTRGPPQKAELEITKLTIRGASVATDDRAAIDEYVRRLDHVMVVSGRCGGTGEEISVGVNQRQPDGHPYNIIWKRFYFSYSDTDR